MFVQLSAHMMLHLAMTPYTDFVKLTWSQRLAATILYTSAVSLYLDLRATIHRDLCYWITSAHITVFKLCTLVESDETANLCSCRRAALAFPLHCTEKSYWLHTQSAVTLTWATNSDTSSPKYVHNVVVPMTLKPCLTNEAGHILPGSAETLIRWGGKLYRLAT